MTHLPDSLKKEFQISQNPKPTDIYAAIKNFRYEHKIELFLDDTITEKESDHYCDIMLPGMPYKGQRFWLTENASLNKDTVCVVKDIDIAVKFFGNYNALAEPCVRVAVHLTKDPEYYKDKE